MKWIIVDEDYLNYLRSAEKRIPFSNYGEDKFKPFFSELFSVGDFVYVSQISHPKERHEKLKNSLDFQKIYISDNQSDNSDRFVAVVNLNYMFPIKKELFSYLEYSKIDECRSFKSQKEKSQYIDLLQKELVALNSLNLERKAKKLYNLKKDFPDNRISLRCLDFLMLEKCAEEYNKSSR